MFFTAEEDLIVAQKDIAKLDGKNGNSKDMKAWASVQAKILINIQGPQQAYIFIVSQCCHITTIVANAN